MANRVQGNNTARATRWRIAGWATAAGLLLLPFAAMQFTKEVNWTASDFVVMGVLLGSVALAFDLLVRRSGSLFYRFGALGAVGTGFLTIWVNLAVGMIGDGDNPHNLLFAGVVLAALVGAFAVRFQAGGMARVMAGAALAQAAFGLMGISADPRGGVLSTGFAILWLIAAALFALAARNDAPRA